MTPVRVRFAPSPTGSLHVGNIRAALFNYLFARQKGGTFILRIEDTDMERNLEHATSGIIQDLAWLGLSYNEGPEVGGEYGPYVQSQRTALYQEKLGRLITSKQVYRCFCSPEELERKRKGQLARRQSPRYDRACLHLSVEMIQSLVDRNTPFVWRLILDQNKAVTITDLARGKMPFELAHFSDVVITRPDGSFTFMFANFVDDWLMGITHVIRGEDHLTNTALQAAMYETFNISMPLFWHLPFICDKEGKKLSKRDACSSLADFKRLGYIPQAVENYLAIIGSSVEQEVQSLEELSRSFDFEKIHSTGSIRFDEEKLAWLNHQWCVRLTPLELLPYCKPLLHEAVVESKNLDDAIVCSLLEKVKGDMHRLTEFIPVITFYCIPPSFASAVVEEEIGGVVIKRIMALLATHLETLEIGGTFFVEALKKDALGNDIKPRDLWRLVRYLLTGSFQGIAVHDIIEMLGVKKTKSRIATALQKGQGG